MKEGFGTISKENEKSKKKKVERTSEKRDAIRRGGRGTPVLA